ncbi:NAD(P)/FAD-dependent oxidoreductase [Bacteroidota bacterium]
MYNQQTYNTIIIGAGASGLIAAVTAAEKGEKVLVLEKMERAGRKLLITGKGRCNITNTAELKEFIQQIHPNGRYLRPAFSKFFSADIIDILEKQGLKTKIERGGRVFPEDDLAKSVVRSLLKGLEKSGAEIEYNARVEKLIIQQGEIKGVEANINGKTERISADKVIICTGGKSYPATGSSGDGYKFASDAGHTIIPVRQALVPLETKGDIASKLQGLALKNVKASVWVNGKKHKDDFGEMLFTHFGLSGPIILTLSGIVVDELSNDNKVVISIDLKPALDDPKLDKRLLRDLDENGKKRLENIFKLWLPSKMIPVFLEKLNLDADKLGHQVSANERKQIRLLMKDFRFDISGYRSFKEAIITAGGVATSEVNSKTMESKLVKGLFFAGEILDLNADTGGYNLQIAWSTGALAGQ